MDVRPERESGAEGPWREKWRDDTWNAHRGAPSADVDGRRESHNINGNNQNALIHLPLGSQCFALNFCLVRVLLSISRGHSLVARNTGLHTMPSGTTLGVFLVVRDLTFSALLPTSACDATRGLPACGASACPCL